jgi:hypothetical protein
MPGTPPNTPCRGSNDSGAVPMLPELLEADATGRIAEIYAEIRRFSGVPYVSSLQRYLATLPGVLEWGWDALRPALASGVIPETGWRLAATVRLDNPAPVSRETCRAAWLLDNTGLAKIRNIAANFVRVSPVNLVTGACLAQLLTGTTPGGGAALPGSWAPPETLPPMPGNVAIDALPPEQKAVLMRFATSVDGVPFIPALYRQIAHYPPVLAWLADELVPRLTAPETLTKGAAFRQAAREASVGIVARLLPLPTRMAPDADTVRKILPAIDRYAETSPEMTLFGNFILDALPPGLEP